MSEAEGRAATTAALTTKETRLKQESDHIEALEKQIEREWTASPGKETETASACDISNYSPSTQGFYERKNALYQRYAAEQVKNSPIKSMQNLDNAVGGGSVGMPQSTEHFSPEAQQKIMLLQHQLMLLSLQQQKKLKHEEKQRKRKKHSHSHQSASEQQQHPHHIHPDNERQVRAGRSNSDGIRQGPYQETSIKQQQLPRSHTADLKKEKRVTREIVGESDVELQDGGLITGNVSRKNSQLQKDAQHGNVHSLQTNFMSALKQATSRTGLKKERENVQNNSQALQSGKAKSVRSETKASGRADTGKTSEQSEKNGKKKGHQSDSSPPKSAVKEMGSMETLLSCLICWN